MAAYDCRLSIACLLIKLFVFTQNAFSQLAISSVKPELDSWKEILEAKFEDSFYSENYRLRLKTNDEKFGEIVLKLTKKSQFFSSHLSNSSVSGCFYEGTVLQINEQSLLENSENGVRLKFCNGVLSGLILLESKMWTLHTEPDGSWIIFSNDDLKDTEKNAGKHCPVEPVSVEEGRESLLRVRRNSFEQTRYVEVSLFHDYAYFDKYGSDVQTINDRAIDIINAADLFYSSIEGLDLNLVLIDVVIWETPEAEPIEATTDAGDLMSSFLAWRYRSLGDLLSHDNGVLITGAELDGSTIGLAPMGTLCRETLSGSIVEDHSSIAAQIAGTLAHELGHNFNLDHNPSRSSDDPCACEFSQCVMDSTTSGRPINFTVCQQEKLKQKLSQGFGVCLNNRPTLTFGDPYCGDKFVNQAWEECDCGILSACDDPCCNASTCMLTPGSQCSISDLCCDNTCQIRTEGAACRDKASSCDLPEYCDGKMSSCPSDVYIQNGEPCNSQNDRLSSHCYYGQCMTVYDQCVDLFDPDDKIELETSEACWRINQKGDQKGNCGEGVTCTEANSRCGKLQCRTSSGSLSVSVSSTTYWTTFGDGSRCYSMDKYQPIADGIDDFSYVRDGTWCADESICIGKQCTNISDIAGLQICPKRCNGHGVCNSENHCHCNVGWAPPLCDVPGNGGSVDSGPASETPDTSGAARAVLVFFLVIIPLLLILALIVFIFRRPIRFHVGKFYQKHFSTFPVDENRHDIGRGVKKSGQSPAGRNSRYTPGRQLGTSAGPADSQGDPQPVPRTKRLPQASDFAVKFDSSLVKQDDRATNSFESVNIYRPRNPPTDRSDGVLPPPPPSVSLKRFHNIDLN